MGIECFIDFFGLFRPPCGARALAAGLGTHQVSYVFALCWKLFHFWKSAVSTLILFGFKTSGLQVEPVHWQLGLKHVQPLMWSFFIGSWFEFEL